MPYRFPRLLRFVLGVAACVAAVLAADDPRSIRVVMDKNYPPYSFESGEGRLQGILVDQWQAWEKKTGIKAELHGLEWADVVPRMRAGDFDVIACIVETAARREYLDFSAPFTTMEVPIYFRKEISGIVDVDSLRGFPVAVKNGDQHIDLLKAAGVSHLISFPNHQAIVAAAKERKIGVFMFDEPSALYHLNKAGIAADFRHSVPAFSDDLKRAVRKGDTTTLRLVTEGFAAITPGELAKIDEKWFGRSISHGHRTLVFFGYAGAAALLMVLGLIGWNWMAERKRTAEAAKQTESRIRLLIDTIPTSAWSVHADGKVEFLNRRLLEYTGRSLDEELADPNGPVHPDDRDAVMKKWTADVANGTPFEGEMRLRRADGVYRWFLVRTVPFRDEQGTIVKWYGASVDIEDRKQTEELLRSQKQQLRALIKRLHAAREEEAKRIARELHDDLGQQLTALNLQLDTLEMKLGDAQPEQRTQIAAMHAVVNRTVTLVQTIASGLRLAQLDVLGLTAAIDWQLQEFSRRSGIPCEVTRLDEITNLSDAQNTSVYRILQEALTNIVRHAGATRVKVSLRRENDRLMLCVEDNGRGITAAELHDRRAIGLLGMRERADIVGGTVAITSEPGQGTTVLVTIPLKSAAPIST